MHRGRFKLRNFTQRQLRLLSPVREQPRLSRDLSKFPHVALLFGSLAVPENPLCRHCVNARVWVHHYPGRVGRLPRPMCDRTLHSGRKSRRRQNKETEKGFVSRFDAVCGNGWMCGQLPAPRRARLTINPRAPHQAEADE